MHQRWGRALWPLRQWQITKWPMEISDPSLHIQGFILHVIWKMSSRAKIKFLFVTVFISLWERVGKISPSYISSSKPLSKNQHQPQCCICISINPFHLSAPVYSLLTFKSFCFIYGHLGGFECNIYVGRRRSVQPLWLQPLILCRNSIQLLLQGFCPIHESIYHNSSFWLLVRWSVVIQLHKWARVLRIPGFS